MATRKSDARERAYDVVLYGATGFVGRQTVDYFAAHAGGLRWALAGRSAEKLAAVRSASGAQDAGLLMADANDADALDKLAAQARVVLSTAGPFALYGSALVAACVARRTHYVDITGETPWVRKAHEEWGGRRTRRHVERPATSATPRLAKGSVSNRRYSASEPSPPVSAQTPSPGRR